MATEHKKDSKTSIQRVDVMSSANNSTCGPGCACGSPSGKNGKALKVAVFLVVVVAVAAILVFKTNGLTQNTTSSATNEFANVLAKTEPSANSAGQPGALGTPVSAIGDLNKVAADLDTVFLLIPTKDNAPAMKETGSALATVATTLHGKDIKTGAFVLQTNSSDYTDVAAMMTPPGIMVLTKGKGMGIVSNGITEENLMQAYVASTSGGCGTGCGPKGCPTSAAPAKKN